MGIAEDTVLSPNHHRIVEEFPAFGCWHTTRAYSPPVLTQMS
jgi:hypothetical protein